MVYVHKALRQGAARKRGSREVEEDFGTSQYLAFTTSTKKTGNITEQPFADVIIKYLYKRL